MRKCTPEVESNAEDRREHCQPDQYFSYGKHIFSLITMTLFITGFIVATIITSSDIRYLYGIIALYFGVIFMLTTAYYALSSQHSVICNIRNWSINAWTNPFLIFFAAAGAVAG